MGTGTNFAGTGIFGMPFFKFFGHGQLRHCPFQKSGHGQGFSPMPYGMPYILGIFAGTGERAFALFVNLRARALWALDF